MSKSWFFELHALGDPKGKFSSNMLRFRTSQEAAGYGRNLASRWFGFDESRVSPSEDEPTHGWDEDRKATYRLDKPEVGYQSLGRVEDARLVNRED